jgi:DNA-binding FrmR family transcriptional regulator
MAQDKIIQKDILINLKKASGNINKIINMVENELYCVDIATQVNAAI